MAFLKPWFSNYTNSFKNPCATIPKFGTLWIQGFGSPGPWSTKSAQARHSESLLLALPSSGLTLSTITIGHVFAGCTGPKWDSFPHDFTHTELARAISWSNLSWRMQVVATGIWFFHMRISRHNLYLIPPTPQSGLFLSQMKPLIQHLVAQGGWMAPIALQLLCSPGALVIFDNGLQLHQAFQGRVFIWCISAYACVYIYIYIWIRYIYIYIWIRNMYIDLESEDYIYIYIYTYIHIYVYTHIYIYIYLGKLSLVPHGFAYCMGRSWTRTLLGGVWNVRALNPLNSWNHWLGAVKSERKYTHIYTYIDIDR